MRNTMRSAPRRTFTKAVNLLGALSGLLIVSCTTGEDDRSLADEVPGPTGGDGGGTHVADSSGGSTTESAAGGSDGGSKNPDDVASGAQGGSYQEISSIYAHVTAVSVSESESGYNLSVSIESADLDCTQFANWWEVLSEEGALLYRRILMHSHTDENGSSDADSPGNTFTRSGGPLDVTGNQKIYVRAHMNTGGYNGDVMVGTIDTGFQVATDLVADFAKEVESEEPQSARCDF